MNDFVDEIACESSSEAAWLMVALNQKCPELLSRVEAHWAGTVESEQEHIAIMLGYAEGDVSKTRFPKGIAADYQELYILANRLLEFPELIDRKI